MQNNNVQVCLRILFIELTEYKNSIKIGIWVWVGKIMYKIPFFTWGLNQEALIDVVGECHFLVICGSLRGVKRGKGTMDNNNKHFFIMLLELLTS